MRGNLTVFHRHRPPGSSIRTPSSSSPHWGECDWRKEGGGATDRALGLSEVTERRRGRRKGRRGRAAATVREGRARTVFKGVEGVNGAGAAARLVPWTRVIIIAGRTNFDAIALRWHRAREKAELKLPGPTWDVGRPDHWSELDWSG
ncbi:hypothetical protein GW17_00020400 [Ensete ventricosum]|nr:hypothetical protein GW17_00020400 [Ensete ventricosum]